MRTLILTGLLAALVTLPVSGCNSDRTRDADDRTREIPPDTKTEELRDSTRLDPAGSEFAPEESTPDDSGLSGSDSEPGH